MKRMFLCRIDVCVCDADACVVCNMMFRLCIDKMGTHVCVFVCAIE